MPQIDEAIKVLPGPEAYDTATVIMRFANGKDAMIDVCRQATYGYDQRAEVLGQKAMIQTDNMYPNTARIFSSTFTGNADMPYDFFMSRYKEAYVQETLAFVDALVNDKPAPCTGEDGLIALVMSIAAGTSAEEKRWVAFSVNKRPTPRHLEAPMPSPPHCLRPLRNAHATMGHAPASPPAPSRLAVSADPSSARFRIAQELAPELCNLATDLGDSPLSSEQCAIKVVDPKSGALNLGSLVDPKAGIIKEKTGIKEKISSFKMPWAK